MTKVLTTQNAQITTVAVEVKTLTISGKQVTLSVFRQLIHESLISVAGTFTGIPWGHVNYHPWKCEDATEHLHVVWQKDAELRRDAVMPPKSNAPIYLDDELGEEWLEAAALDGWKPTGNRTGRLIVEFPAGGVTIVVDDRVSRVLWPYTDYTRDKAIREIEEQGIRSRDELRSLVNDGIRAEIARRERLKSRWDELSALPHLFIAV